MIHVVYNSKLAMMTFKSHSVNFYVSIFTLVGLLMLLIIGLNMSHEITSLEHTFAVSHQKYAKRELDRGINNVILRVNEAVNQLAQWDETSQELTDPTYYRFWRQQRLQSTQLIPEYINYIELYDKNGFSLLQPDSAIMPKLVPASVEQIVFHDKRPWLLVFRPVMLYQNGQEIFGYVGVAVDFVPALMKLNLFTHLDPGSISVVSAPNHSIDTGELVNYFIYGELHASELDQLKRITFTTFAYIVGMVLIILVLLYWMVISLFAKPLTKLNRYLESLRQLPESYNVSPDMVSFPLTEFNNFLQSLQRYQINLYDTQNNLKKLNNDLEKRVVERTSELQSKNKELESFSYSVSHDLRAPLRSIDGYTQVLLEDYVDTLDDVGRGYLERVRSNTRRMSELIDDLLDLARISRQEITHGEVNLSAIAARRIQMQRELDPQARVSVIVEDGLYALGDEHLITIAIDNLIDNAWKYSSKVENPVIEVGRLQKNNETIFFVKDNGVGFEMKYAGQIFKVFNRLHGSEFEGTGIGLATVQRILARHGGRIWVEAEPNKGACFYFVLKPADGVDGYARQLRHEKHIHETTGVT